MRVRSFADEDEAAVVDLWRRVGITGPWNDPVKDVARKRRVQRELFLVAVDDDVVVGTAMAGYDGHHGWVNYLAVEPSHRRRGIGRTLMAAAEAGLAPTLTGLVGARSHHSIRLSPNFSLASDCCRICSRSARTGRHLCRRL